MSKQGTGHTSGGAPTHLGVVVSAQNWLLEVRTKKRFKPPQGMVPDLHQMVLHLAELHDILNFQVSPRFPVGMARKLRESGMTLEIANGSGLFPGRQIKTAAEVEALRKGDQAVDNHCVGHGVGSEIHEEPILRSKAPCKLRKGMVVTVEPGLYDRGLGGCRNEDTVHLVTGGSTTAGKPARVGGLTNPDR